MTEGKLLIDELLSNPNSFSQYNELLNWLYRYYDPQILETLLRSEDEKIVAAGLFFAEELSERVNDNIPQISQLCKHHLEGVRVEAIHTLAVCLSRPTFRYIETLVQSSFSDKSERCRVAACFELLRVDERLLSEFIQNGPKVASSVAACEFIKHYLQSILTDSLEAYRASNSNETKVAIFVAVARSHPDLLQQFSMVPEDDIRKSAEMMLRYLALRHKHGRMT
jgi:hypothetical protein